MKRWVQKDRLPVEELVEARGFGESSFEPSAWDELNAHLARVAPTQPNIPGPFYKPNAPFRVGGVIAKRAEPGPRITVRGRVTDEDERPLRNVVLDIWQATNVGGRGAYDTRPDRNFPTNPRPNAPEAPIAKDPEVGFHLRGRVRTDGEYSFETIKPGRYPLNDKQDRPAHIHVKVTAPGYKDLTTQLYFPDDNLNTADPFFLEGLLIKMQPNQGEMLQGAFDFVLSNA